MPVRTGAPPDEELLDEDEEELDDEELLELEDELLLEELLLDELEEELLEDELLLPVPEHVPFDSFRPIPAPAVAVTMLLTQAGVSMR